MKDEKKLLEMEPVIKEVSLTSEIQLQEAVAQLEATRNILARENQVRTSCLS